MTPPDEARQAAGRAAQLAGSSFVAPVRAFEAVPLGRPLRDTNHIYETCIVVANYNDVPVNVSPVVMHQNGATNEAASRVFRDRLRLFTDNRSQPAGYAVVPAGSARKTCFGKEDTRTLNGDIYGHDPVLVFASRPVHVNVYSYYHSDPREVAPGFPIDCDRSDGVAFLCRLSVRALSGATLP